MECKTKRCIRFNISTDLLYIASVFDCNLVQVKNFFEHVQLFIFLMGVRGHNVERQCFKAGISLKAN